MVVVRLFSLLITVAMCVLAYKLTSSHVVSLSMTGLSEIVNGLLISVASKLSEVVVSLLNKFEVHESLEGTTQTLYTKKFMSAIAPILVSVIVSLSTLFDPTKSKFLTLFYGGEDPTVLYDSSLFACKE